MSNSFNEKKLTILLKKLSSEEKIWLLRELLADYWHPPLLEEADAILATENWFMNRAMNAHGTRESSPRHKFWVIFLLLRYGGLRLQEINLLSSVNFNLASGVINVPGEYARIAPLPLPVAQRLERIAKTQGIFFGFQPLRCDASQLRRLFRRCAKDLGIDRNLLTIRSLHNLRALELQKAGVHPQLVKRFFQGSKSGVDCFNNPDDILTRQVQKEIRMEKLIKTSARNVFKGVVSKIANRGILVDVIMKTAEGLEISSIITQTSAASLELQAGKPVTALVKAPWVKIAPLDKKASSSAETNIFEGEIEAFNEDEQAAEILLKLSQGPLLCSVYAGEKPAVPLKAGVKVNVEISAFAIILLTA